MFSNARTLKLWEKRYFKYQSFNILDNFDSAPASCGVWVTVTRVTWVSLSSWIIPILRDLRQTFPDCLRQFLTPQVRGSEQKQVEWTNHGGGCIQQKGLWACGPSLKTICNT